METNRFATLKFELKPPPRFTVPVVPLEPKFAETSTLRIEGDLARRPLLTPMKLPSWPYADVIAPSKVQVLVNAAGEVVSAVLLPSDNSGEVHDADADQRALELARAARFAPASDLTIGKLIFNWCTVPPPATNAPPGFMSMSADWLIVIYVALALGALCVAGDLFRNAPPPLLADAHRRPDFPLRQLRLRLHRRPGRGPFALFAMRQAERAD